MFSTTGPTQSPVSGHDPIGNLAEPLQALSQFYKALNTRGMQMMEQNWVASPPAAMDNAARWHHTRLAQYPCGLRATLRCEGQLPL